MWELERELDYFLIFFVLTLILPSQWGFASLVARLPRPRGVCMEPFLKIPPNQKKENSCCACMNAWRQSSKTSAASNPQGWFFCVHREILPPAHKTSLFILLENWLNTIQVQNISASAWKNSLKGPVHTKSLSNSVDGVGITLPISHRPLSVHQKSHRKSP